MISKVALDLLLSAQNPYTAEYKMNENFRNIHENFPNILNNTDKLRTWYPALIDSAVRGEDLSDKDYYRASPALRTTGNALLGALIGAWLGGAAGSGKYNTLKGFGLGTGLGALVGAGIGGKIGYNDYYSDKAKMESAIADEIYNDFSRKYKPVYKNISETDPAQLRTDVIL